MESLFFSNQPSLVLQEPHRIPRTHFPHVYLPGQHVWSWSVCHLLEDSEAPQIAHLLPCATNNFCQSSSVSLYNTI